MPSSAKPTGAVEPGMAIMSVHHKASIAKGRFHLVQPRLLVRSGSGRAHRCGCCSGLGGPRFEPRAGAASGEPPGQPGLRLLRRRRVPPTHRGHVHSRSDTTRRPHRGRHHSHKLVSRSWTGKAHVEFNEDMVMSDMDVEPLHQALRGVEHVLQTLLTGSWIENL